jgi:uncharacterized protein (TIGR03067 family)
VASAAEPVAELQGRWEVVELVEDGKVVPREAIREWLPSGGRCEISENAVIFAANGDRQVKLFSVDATQYPRQIDLVSKDKKDAVGIYRMDAGKLVLCLVDPTEASRPEDFSSKEGSKRMLMVLEPAKVATPAAAPTPRAAPPKPQTGVAGKLLTDDEVTKMLAGTWRYVDDIGALYVTFAKDGTFSTVREVQQIRLFQKAFVRTPVSSGRWSVNSGNLTFAISASTHPDRVNKQFPFAVRSISDRDFIFVDYLGRVGKAARVP